LNGVEVGDEVRVMFNVASREYNNKWYSDITAYQLDNISKKEYENSISLPPERQETITLNLDVLATSNENDDLPF
jgi:hypothetical protein